MVRSSQSIGSIPDVRSFYYSVHKLIQWVPLDTAALALGEMRNSEQLFLNLVRGVGWTRGSRSSLESFVVLGDHP